MKCGIHEHWPHKSRSRSCFGNIIWINGFRQPSCGSTTQNMIMFRKPLLQAPRLSKLTTFITPLTSLVLSAAIMEWTFFPFTQNATHLRHFSIPRPPFCFGVSPAAAVNEAGRVFPTLHNFYNLLKSETGN